MIIYGPAAQGLHDYIRAQQHKLYMIIYEPAAQGLHDYIRASSTRFT